MRFRGFCRKGGLRPGWRRAHSVNRLKRYGASQDTVTAIPQFARNFGWLWNIILLLCAVAQILAVLNYREGEDSNPFP